MLDNEGEGGGKNVEINKTFNQRKKSTES